MEAHLIQQIQREGAEALLDVGVSVPLLDLKLPFKRRPVPVRLTMTRPTLGTLIEMAKIWLSTGMTLEEFRGLDFDGQLSFLVHHGKKLSRMLALAVRQRWVPVGVLSWAIRRWVPWVYQKGIFEKFVTLMGTESFLPIISAVERMNPMKLRLSHSKRGS